MSRRSLLRGASRTVTLVPLAPLVGSSNQDNDNPQAKDQVVSIGNNQVDSQNEQNENQPLHKNEVAKAQENREEDRLTVFDKLFGNLSDQGKDEARRKIDEWKIKIGMLEDYGSMSAFQRAYGDRLKKTAGEFKLEPQFLMGMVLIESGGDGSKASEAGAKGIAQIVDNTARIYSKKYQEIYGEDINAKGDFRENPYLSMIIMAWYESDMKKKFGNNDGLAMLTYNWGEGTMTEALRVYFKDTTGADIGDYESTLSDHRLPERRLAIEDAADKLVIATKLNVHQLLSNPAVQREVIDKMDNPEEGRIYFYKAVAAAELFEN